MTKPTSFVTEQILSGQHAEDSQVQATGPIDEKLQKALDRTLYANGNPGAQKVRNFLNGTWLGEPLHVVLKDVPIGAWTVAMVFDVLDLIGNRPEFAAGADTSIAIGLVAAAGAAGTGLTDWTDSRSAQHRSYGFVCNLAGFAKEEGKKRRTNFFSSRLRADVVRSPPGRGAGIQTQGRSR